MADRGHDRAAFLAATRWGMWQQRVLAGDASQRAYVVLTGPNGAQAILMDADPKSGEDVGPFLTICQHLRQTGLCAPEVYLEDRVNGFLVLEYLGPDTFADTLRRDPSRETLLYQHAAKAILKYGAATPPSGLKTLTSQVAGEMVDLYAQWAVEDCTTKAQQNLSEAMTEAYDKLVPDQKVLSLRDFHAENLIWRADRIGLDRVGILDFQDAFLAPQSYDLMSLLRDPRRDVAANTVEHLTRDFAGALGVSDHDFGVECACVSVQRNLRIAGIFHRLSRRDKKPRYAQFLPLVLSHIDRDLAHPKLWGLRRAVAACGVPLI